jgi:hypothetical protein
MAYCFFVNFLIKTAKSKVEKLFYFIISFHCPFLSIISSASIINITSILAISANNKMAIIYFSFPLLLFFIAFALSGNAFTINSSRHPIPVCNSKLKHLLTSCPSLLMVIIINHTFGNMFLNISKHNSGTTEKFEIA